MIIAFKAAGTKTRYGVWQIGQPMSGGWTVMALWINGEVVWVTEENKAVLDSFIAYENKLKWKLIVD